MTRHAKLRTEIAALERFGRAAQTMSHQRPAARPRRRPIASIADALQGAFLPLLVLALAWLSATVGVANEPPRGPVQVIPPPAVEVAPLAD